MFDSHCHLTTLLNNHSLLNSFQIQTPSTIPNKIQQDLCAINHPFLCVSAQPSDWDCVIQLSEQIKTVYPALGLHPWYVNDDYLVHLDTLQKLILNHEITALGEIGLDFMPAHRENKQDQIVCFDSQLKIAQCNKLPVSLHIVKAHNEAIESLKKVPVKGVVHGLGSSVEIAKQYIDLGLKFGVNGIVTRQNAVRYHKLVRYFGVEHIVLETDYANIKLPNHAKASLDDIYVVAEYIAELLNLPYQSIITSTDNNARSIFNLDE